MTMMTSVRPAHAPRPAVSAIVSHLFGVWRQRRNLSQLDDHALRDIGLSRAEADAESRRSFWDAPETWQC